MESDKDIDTSSLRLTSLTRFGELTLSWPAPLKSTLLPEQLVAVVDREEGSKSGEIVHVRLKDGTVAKASLHKSLEVSLVSWRGRETA